MAKLIFLTGMMGVGKSTLAKRFIDYAYYIHGDAVHVDAARRAFPFIKESQEYSWRAWPQDVQGTMHVTDLLKLSLGKTHLDLRRIHSMSNVIVDGAIFCNDWFRTPFIEALRDIGYAFEEHQTHFICLRPPSDKHYKQILARAECEPYRANEKLKYTCIEDVERGQAGFETILNRSLKPWQILDSTEVASDYIASIFS